MLRQSHRRDVDHQQSLDSVAENRHVKPTEVAKQHVRQLIFSVLGVRALVLSVALLSSFLSPFDSSATIVLDLSSRPAFSSESLPRTLLRRFLSTCLRWDAIHFFHIAQYSYVYEHEFAFLPGIAFVLNIGAKIFKHVSSWTDSATASPYEMLAAHLLLSTLVTCDAIQTLYRLTLHHTGAPQLALLTGYLSLVSSSPATLHLAPYTEPWFTWASYRGMLYCARREWIKACAAFIVAGFFRSNAILLGGFILWGLIIDPFLSMKRIPATNLLIAPILSAIPSLPFLLHQLKGYQAFCHTQSPRPWCSRQLPFIYTFVQSEYWDSGFLRYWKIQQLPNFILAAPVLLLLCWGSVSFILKVGRPLLMTTYHNFLFSNPAASKRVQTPPANPLLVPSLLPHAIHAFILTLTLLFAAHTQIILRLASSMPFTYWTTAWLFLNHPRWAKAWVVWSIVWGAVSVVLWVVFLPPA